MRVILLGFAAFLSFGIAVEAGEEADNRLLPVQPPDTPLDSVENSNDLLSTLLELHQNLITQIALLQNMPKTSVLQSQSETDHLVQHYTAQKNNIEREISLIKSIQDTKVPAEAPRHIFQSLAPEQKTVSSLFNIFKRPKNPTTNDYNDDVAYSLPYPAYYVPDHGQPFPYPYQGVPPKPNYSHENTLIEDTFPGYSQQSNEGGVYMTKSQRRPSKKDYQDQPKEQPSLHIPPQFDPAPQVMLKPQVQPPQVDPQRSPYPPQLQVDDDPYRSQQIPNRQSQIRDEDILRIEQQGQYGQKQGLLVYYPDGIITENEDRPSIVDRFGQVIDRFGEVISSLANRQRNTGYDRNQLQKRVKYRPRASSDEKVTPRKTEEKKPKMRWVAV